MIFTVGCCWSADGSHPGRSPENTLLPWLHSNQPQLMSSRVAQFQDSSRPSSMHVWGVFVPGLVSARAPYASFMSSSWSLSLTRGPRKANRRRGRGRPRPPDFPPPHPPGRMNHNYISRTAGVCTPSWERQMHDGKKSKLLEAVGNLAPVIRVDRHCWRHPRAACCATTAWTNDREKAVLSFSLLSKIHCQSSDIAKPMILKINNQKAKLIRLNADSQTWAETRARSSWNLLPPSLVWIRAARRFYLQTARNQTKNEV